MWNADNYHVNYAQCFIRPWIIWCTFVTKTNLVESYVTEGTWNLSWHNAKRHILCMYWRSLIIRRPLWLKHSPNDAKMLSEESALPNSVVNSQFTLSIGTKSLVRISDKSSLSLVGKKPNEAEFFRTVLEVWPSWVQTPPQAGFLNQSDKCCKWIFVFIKGSGDTLI